MINYRLKRRTERGTRNEIIKNKNEEGWTTNGEKNGTEDMENI